MFYDIVATARDWAIILLALEAIILCAVPLFVLWYVTRAIGSFLPRVRPGLQHFQAQAIGISEKIEQASEAVRAPFVWIEATQARVQGFRRAWTRD